MRFREFESKIEDLPLFNLNDVRKFDPGFHRRQLVDWQKRGYIQALAGGTYILAGRKVDEGLLFMAANQIYAPSYVSLESALDYHQIIPESVLGVTSVSARKTKQFGSSWGQFSYRSVKPEYMFGYQVIVPEPHQKFLVATLEKAVLDYLYLNPHIQTLNDFEALRWSRTALVQLINNATFDHYLNIFDKKALRDRVKILMRYFNA
jgi:predicted transcriptional regulator of viral defense system